MIICTTPWPSVSNMAPQFLPSFPPSLTLFPLRDPLFNIQFTLWPILDPIFFVTPYMVRSWPYFPSVAPSWPYFPQFDPLHDPTWPKFSSVILSLALHHSPIPSHDPKSILSDWPHVCPPDLTWPLRVWRCSSSWISWPLAFLLQGVFDDLVDDPALPVRSVSRWVSPSSLYCLVSVCVNFFFFLQ